MVRWDRGAALAGLDLDEWVSRFRVRYVPAKVLGGGQILGLNANTTLGKEFRIPRYEIWLADDAVDLERFLVLHEAVEMYLREQGWLYEPSHEYAERVVQEILGEDPDYEEYRTT